MGKKDTTKAEAAKQERAKAKLAKLELKAANEQRRAAEKAAKAEEKRIREERAKPKDGWLADPTQCFVAIDLATTSGYAIFDGPNLVEAGTIKPFKAAHSEPWERYVRTAERPTGAVSAVFIDERTAWESLGDGMRFDMQLGQLEAARAPAYVMFEAVFVGFNKGIQTALGLSRHRGAVDVYLGARAGGVKAFEVTVTTWRKQVAADLGVVWPVGDGKPTKKDAGLRRAMTKRKSIETVQKYFGVTLSDDAAEAVLIGWYFTRMYFPLDAQGSVRP